MKTNQIGIVDKNKSDQNLSRWIAEMSKANKEKVAQEQAKAQEPIYAVFDAEAIGSNNAYRFAINNQNGLDELLSLNGLSDISEVVPGQSYRVK